MPIYAYRCDACGHQQDVLQKISAEPLTVCTACGAAAFKKQVTAAGFQLKGSGWYVTDFRNNGSAPAKAAPAKTADGEAAAASSTATTAVPASTPAASAPATSAPAAATPST